MCRSCPHSSSISLRVTRAGTLDTATGVLSAPLTANIVLFVIVHSYTVNPTLFHPSLLEPHYGFLTRIARRGLAYEYTKLGAVEYGDFIDALQQTGRAVRARCERPRDFEFGEPRNHHRRRNTE